MSASISRDSASRCGGGAAGAGGGAAFGAGWAVVFGTNRSDGISMQPSDRQIRKCVASPANAGVASKQAAATRARRRSIMLSLGRWTHGVPAGLTRVAGFDALHDLTNKSDCALTIFRRRSPRRLIFRAL